MISPLVTDQKDQPDEEMDLEDFVEEQTTVAKFISLFSAQEPDQQYVVRKIVIFASNIQLVCIIQHFSY